MNEKYWLTPPELYQKLDKEFNFDFDPCPYAKTFDSLKIPWGKMNYVNPPFKKEDGGTAPFIHKAIEESKKGNSSFIVFNVRNVVNVLLEENAIPRSLGRVKWLECENKTQMPGPPSTVGFFLQGKK